MGKKIKGAIYDKKGKLLGVPYEHYLYKELKDPKEALAHLNMSVQVALEEDEPQIILIALYDVAQAQGMNKTAKLAGIHRVSLHRMLTKGGNPEWKSIFRVLSALHLSVRFERFNKLAA